MDKFQNYKKSKNISITSNKYREYDITIESELNSLINIVAFEKDNNNKYYEHYDLDNLRKIKYFSLFESIDEIFEEIKDKITKNDPQLSEESNSLKLIINTGNTKFKEIIFNVKKNEKEYNEKINEIFSIINDLKEKERKQDKKIQLFEDKINNLNEIINELNKRNYELEEELRKIKEELKYKNSNHNMPLENRNRLRQRQRYRYRDRRNYYQNVRRSKQIGKLNNSSNYNSRLNFNNDKKEEKPLNENLYENEIQFYPKIEEIKEPKKKSKMAMLFDEMEREKTKENKKSKLAMLADEIKIEKAKEKKKSKLSMLFEQLVKENSKEKKKKVKGKHTDSKNALSKKEEEDLKENKYN